MSLVPLFLCAAFAQDATDRVIAEAQKPSALESNLQRLTDQVGGRVPGTPAMQMAVDWGVASFKEAGAASVHTESFSIPASWAEGATRMTVVAPEQFTLRAVSIALGSGPCASHARARRGSRTGKRTGLCQSRRYRGCHPLGSLRGDAYLGRPLRRIPESPGRYRSRRQG